MPPLFATSPASLPLAEIAQGSVVRRLVLIVLGVMVLAAAARINVPIYPVPMSLQSLAVLVIAALAGGRLAGETIGAYLIAGAAGFPVFASGGGLGYFAGPTAGYLFGYLAAALVIGTLADRGWNRRVITLAASLTLGHVVLFAFGVAWLAVLTGIEVAISSGFLVFIPGSIVKIALGTALVAGFLQRDVARDI